MIGSPGEIPINAHKYHNPCMLVTECLVIGIYHKTYRIYKGGREHVRYQI